MVVGRVRRVRRARAAALVAGAVTVVGAWTGSMRVQRMAKPLMVPALAAGLDPARDRVLLAGLAAATVGDVLLIDPDDDSALEWGARAFAVMQGSYTYLLFRRGARPAPIDAIPRYAGWLAASVLLARRQPAVASTLIAYGAVLATTSTLSARSVSRGGDPRLVIGGVLFTVSDALIVFRRLFLTDDRQRRAAEAVVLSTYLAAQVLLVEALASG
ncbi:lysoplasmalogenase [Rhodococcus sp. 15-2388-1-1a]|uniref:lysoplasmalogenase n=1 Tax=Nocardiaceae TaxID=85025 RepID=UPI000566DB42|nr:MULTISPECIES: lysoplasmalogenase [Rhodococcus]OZE91358.1 lysoplasmalogenase [Rhodococcus sp. 15-2388-1-1a]